MCALEMQRANLSVVVLEARSRFGGRILVSPGGTDLGGSWAWPGDSPNVLALGRQLGVETALQRTEGNAHQVQRGSARNIGPQGGSIIPSGPGAIRPNYVELTRRMMAQLSDVRLDSRVLSVTMNGHAFDVVFGNPNAPTTIQSKKVVVAVPPAVMADNIIFSPPLEPRKLQKSRQTATWCGDWVKLALECKSPFWRETGSSGIVVTSGPIEVFWEGGPSSLVGLGVGAKATAFARDADEAMLRQFAIETLGPVFPRLQEELVAVHIHAWASDKETYSPTGRARDYGHALLREPTHHGVHFAGTETERMNGHAEGALVAGKRAALEVIEALRADVCSDLMGL